MLAPDMVEHLLLDLEVVCTDVALNLKQSLVGEIGSVYLQSENPYLSYLALAQCLIELRHEWEFIDVTLAWGYTLLQALRAVLSSSGG